jgi:TolB-like protein/Tfp pilus assembly protein PilF
MSPDPNDEYFADGMTEELIDRLAQVKSLKVIARTSVMSYKKKEKKASEIARELEVGTLVEGSVRKAGNRVRVTVQLINASNEEHLWSSHYDKNLDDIFAVQSEIAEKVAGELKTQLLESERRVLEKKPTENTEAYTCFLRGRELAREETEPSLRQAVGLMEKAVELDPSFAKAYAGLADCFLMLANEIYEPYEKAIPKAEVFVKKALALDPELAEAMTALALIHFLGDDILACENEARRAIELNPSLAEAHRLLSNVASFKGENDEGIRLLETAYRLDPVRPRYVERLGSLYLYMGRENEALQFWERTSKLAPAGTYRNMTEYHLNRGDIAKATELHSMAEKLEPTNPWVTWMKGMIAARKGDREAARQAVRKIEENWSGALDLNGLAFIYYALGDLDSYFTYIKRATDQHLLQYA